MQIPFDPDFDKPTLRTTAPPTPSQSFHSTLDAFSGPAAFTIGLLTAWLVLGAIGFFILLFSFFL